jgi:hypothetical protein
MSKHFDSERDLFEDTDSEGQTGLKRLSLASRLSLGSKAGGHQRKASLKRPPGFLRMSGAEGSGGSGSGKDGKDEKREPILPPGDNNKGKGRAKTAGALTVLNLGEQAETGGVLARLRVNSKGEKVVTNFWNQVAKLNMYQLEVVLGMAKTDANYDMDEFIEGIMYQGFDREAYIKAALEKVTVEVFCQFAVLGAIRGSNFTKIIETSENVPEGLKKAFNSAGFVKTPKKKLDLTILRCTASIPHWCVFWMNKAGVPAKLGGNCPAALQFPGAASVPMSKANRIAHIEFCQAFSQLLPGGKFKVSIYVTAYNAIIPMKFVPDEIKLLLAVSSDAEARTLSVAEIQDNYGKALVKA